MSEFTYLVCVLDESGTDVAECIKVTIGKKVAGTIRFLVNARDLQLESVRVLHEGLLIPVLLYVVRENCRSMIMPVQMDNLRLDRVLNVQIWKLCMVVKLGRE